MRVIRLLLLFGVSFSLVSLPSTLTGPASTLVPTARGSTAPVEAWNPAGPSVDKLLYAIFPDDAAELTALESDVTDLADSPLPPDLIRRLTGNPNFYVTAPISNTGYFELQFHLAQNFWGCNMDFGNSACGTHIRQGIGHLFDKRKFTETQVDIASVSIPIDNPVPPSVTLVSPNPCSWDPLFPQNSANCVVGAPGGTAYHLDSATAGVGPSFPQYSWTPGLGTPDFCAAADHFIAAGLATGKAASTCVLTGIQPAVSANTVNIFVRSDHNPRLQAGNSYAQAICAILTGSFTVACPGFLTNTHGPITAFPGFDTSQVTVEHDWHIYTAGFGNVLTFDSSLFFGYHSQFVSGIPSIKQANGGPCSNDATPSPVADNYLYMCSQAYDSLISQAEFSPCLSAPGDPVNGQTTPTFANCPSTRLLSAKSASYQAQDVFGRGGYTIPMWSSASRFAYRSNWQRVVLDKGNGFVPPGNIPAEFNAWSPSPVVARTIRQGYSQTTTSLNPFLSSTPWDLGVADNIWDRPSRSNPDSPLELLEWMTVSTVQLENSRLTYTPAFGTVATFRHTLRNDIFWHTGQKVTAWDLAFSYISLVYWHFRACASCFFQIGAKVLSPTQVDINVNHLGPFTRLFLSATTTVLPGRFWSSCGDASWDKAASDPSFAAANAALTPCIGPDVTRSGVILSTGAAVDLAKLQPTYDPLASGILVGSGPWVCRSSRGDTGKGCSSTGSQNPPPGGSYTLQRFGVGFAPGASLTGSYFRSSGNLALWIWSGNTGDFTQDFLNFGVVALCFGAPLQPLGSTSGCGHWQQGIGAPGGHAAVGLTQISVVQRFVGVNWVAPYGWTNSPPQGIAAFPPTLYEGDAVLNPATSVGCSSPYPAGGYDC